MLSAIASVQPALASLSESDRNSILVQLQLFLVARVQEHHNRQRLKPLYNPSKSTWQFVRDLLTAAREVGKEGQVAQYIVGAKLQLRYPAKDVSNHSYSTADVQLGRQGDFEIGDTVFHVTVSPMSSVYEKCKRNIDDGGRAYLLVPNDVVVGAKQNAEVVAEGQIVVEAIETFVSQNIDELASFGSREQTQQINALLETYNRRVDAIENDKSLLIELPTNLA